MPSADTTGARQLCVSFLRAPVRAAVTRPARELRYRRPGGAGRPLFAEPPLFSRLKIVWGSFGTEPGAGTLLGLGGVGGLSRRGEAMLTRLAQRPSQDQPSQAPRTPASGSGTTPIAGRPLRSRSGAPRRPRQGRYPPLAARGCPVPTRPDRSLPP